MKKKTLLLVLPILFSFGCDNKGDLADQKYYFGADASTIKNELSKKMETNDSSTNWKGMVSNLKIGVSGSVSLPAESSTTLTSATQTYTISLETESTSKMTFNVDELSSEIVDLEKIVTMESHNSLSASISTTMYNEAFDIDLSAKMDTNYGYATLLPSASAEQPVSTDYLFSRGTISYSLNDQKKPTESKLGFLQGGIMKQFISPSNSSTVITSSELVPVVENGYSSFMDALSIFLDDCGFASSGNDYYISFDLSKLFKYYFNTNNEFVTGTVYFKLSFDKQDLLKSFEIEAKDVGVLYTDTTGLSINLTINIEGKVSKYEGTVATITQADVNEFGYENLLPLEQMVY